MGELGRLGDTEVRFYSQLSNELSGLPKAYGSAFDALTGRYIIVLEDLPAEQCEFPDPPAIYPSRTASSSTRTTVPLPPSSPLPRTSATARRPRLSGRAPR